VREVTLYVWGLPQDHALVLRMIDDLSQGSIDALAFTGQPQAGNLITIASQAGKEASLRESLTRPLLVVASAARCAPGAFRKRALKLTWNRSIPTWGA
tara:strand:+ start:572 stop:865 length:294 start_codon:yes stop_codon:yes gene_type:complete